MRSVHRLAAFVICTAVLVPVMAQDSTYDVAAEALRSGDYVAAAAGFERLIEDRPGWVPGHVALGQCYYLLGQPERGESRLRHAATLDPRPDLFLAYYAVGQMLYQKQQYARAIAPLKRALEYAGATQRVSTELRLAHAYLMADRATDARRSLEAWITAHGESFDSSYYLALACRKLGDYDCALAGLRTARRVDDAKACERGLPEKLAGWSYYWSVRPENAGRRERLVDAAVADARSWYELDTADAAATRHYAETLVAAERYSDAEELLSPLAARDEKDCGSRLLLARAANGSREAEEAERWASDALSCDPTADGALVELAAAQIGRLVPEHSDLAEVRADLELLNRAIASLDRAIELAGDGVARARTLRAAALETTDRLKQVEAELIERDEQYDIDVKTAQLEEIRRRCETALWKADHGLGLTDEEKAFVREADCRALLR